MWVVYILRSKKYPNKIYKGFTTRLSRRLDEHNSGKSSYTNKFCPWQLIFYACFETEGLAKSFEKYLKSASGIAFLRKRLIDQQKSIISDKEYKNVKKRLLR